MSEHGELLKLSLIRRPTTTRKQSLLCDTRTLNTWSEMKCTISDIMRQESSKEVITDTVYNAVRLPLMRNSDFIYSDLYGHLESIVDGIAENLLENTQNEFLRNLLDAWTKFRLSVTLISHLFPILDGVVARETDCSFVNVGRSIFENVIFQDEAIRDCITRSLLSMVEDERSGTLTDRSLFTRTCATLKFMSICDRKRYNSFEKKFLEESKFYYKRKCQELLSTDDTYEYLSRVDVVLRREENRLSFCLQESTARANVVLAEKELVQRRLYDIIALERNSLMEMLCENKTHELALLYKVVRRAMLGKTAISDHVNLYLEKRTRQLRVDMEVLGADTIVNSVFEIGDQMDSLVESCFAHDTFLKNAVCVAFRRFVTCDEKLAVFLAEYTDDLLRNYNREYAPDVDGKLCKVFKVTSCLLCKDAVQSLHKLYLSVRLLLDGPNFQEDVAVAQLQFVLRRSLMDVRGMLQDVKRSEMLSDIFEKHPKIVRPTSRGPACEFSMRLLSSAFWPLVPPAIPNVVLPPRPRCHFINFGNFYRSISRSRKLILLPQYGTAEIIVFETECRSRTSRVSFGSFRSTTSDMSSTSHVSKSIVSKLEVSTVQMCILSLFNAVDQLCVKEMKRQTNIEMALILSALKPLCAKKVLLADNPKKPKELHIFSEFRVNPDLYSTNTVKTYDLTENYKSSMVENTMKITREMKTDVVILRIMKVNNVLAHESLVSETIKILKNSEFLPTSLYVTRRIISLIDRNMLKRTPEYSNIYSFKW